MAERLVFGLSALTVVVGLVAQGWQWGALGVAVGGPGMVLPFLTRRQSWPADRVWLLLGLVAVLDAGVLSAVASTPGT